MSPSNPICAKENEAEANRRGRRRIAGPSSRRRAAARPGGRPATRHGDQPDGDCLLHIDFACSIQRQRIIMERGGKKDDIEAETVDYCARDPINIILHTQGVPALATSSEGAESCDEDAARCWGVGDERRERSSGDTRGGRVGSECEVMREAGLLLPKLRDRSLWGKAARGKRRLAHLLNNQEQRLEQAHGEPELVTGS
uniref:Uncharacterized protein n=1 Tax=Oryza rufipogon TaxID=4529 RepID=A0A0E0P8U0_ORYRU